jgi:hypothetical protein
MHTQGVDGRSRPLLWTIEACPEIDAALPCQLVKPISRGEPAGSILIQKALKLQRYRTEQLFWGLAIP